ncbi:MAG: preprotein translocase subunit SecG [Planctomycetota bacterium]|nr:preprotein translocase subunit SecG [Planctomycetota bacterium]MDA1179597.1 preprotein translocase subunit SecG [Planctomycetota bacterium]
MLIADAGLKHYLMGWMMGLISLFIILLILVQRGRGGGLAGALGGLGGQSAFGAKAGDNFTKVTIIAASCWIIVCILAIKVLPTNRFTGAEAGTTSVPSSPPAKDKAGAGSSTTKGGTGDPPAAAPVAAPVADSAGSSGETAPSEPVADVPAGSGS